MTERQTIMMDELEDKGADIICRTCNHAERERTVTRNSVRGVRY